MVFVLDIWIQWDGAQGQCQRRTCFECTKTISCSFPPLFRLPVIICILLFTYFWKMLLVGRRRRVTQRQCRLISLTQQRPMNDPPQRHSTVVLTAHCSTLKGKSFHYLRIFTEKQPVSLFSLLLNMPRYIWLYLVRHRHKRRDTINYLLSKTVVSFGLPLEFRVALVKMNQENSASLWRMFYTSTMCIHLMYPATAKFHMTLPGLLKMRLLDLVGDEQYNQLM